MTTYLGWECFPAYFVFYWKAQPTVYLSVSHSLSVLCSCLCVDAMHLCLACTKLIWISWDPCHEAFLYVKVMGFSLVSTSLNNAGYILCYGLQCLQEKCFLKGKQCLNGAQHFLKIILINARLKIIALAFWKHLEF